MQRFQEEDQALFEAIEAYRNGNDDKATVIYEKTKKYTFNILHKEVERYKNQGALTSDVVSITEDIMQELYIEFFNKITNFRNEDPKSIFKWISVVAHRRLSTYVKENGTEVLRFEKNEDYREDNDIWDASEINDSDMESNHELLPEAALEDKEFRQLIMDFIQSLPEAQAQTILLHFRGGMKYQEIADEMGVSLITVKTRMKKAKDSLEEIITKYEKKTGTKLHSVSILPLLWLLYRMASKDTTVPVAVDAAVTSSLAGASSAGVGSVTVTKAIGTRVLIGIVSATVVIGGALGISQLNRQDTSEPPVIEEEQEDIKEFNADYFEGLMYIYWSEGSANVETKDIDIEKFTEFASYLLVEDNVLNKEIKQSDEAKYIEVSLEELKEFYANTLGREVDEDILNQIYEYIDGLYKVPSRENVLKDTKYEILEKNEETVVLSGSYDINGETGEFEMHGQKRPESHLGGYIIDTFYFKRPEQTQEVKVEEEETEEETKSEETKTEVQPEQAEGLACPRCNQLIDKGKTPYYSTDWQGNNYNVYQCLNCLKMIEKCPKCEDGYFQPKGITLWGGYGMKCDVCGHTQTEVCIENCPHCKADTDIYSTSRTYRVLFNSEPVTGLANRYYQWLNVTSMLCRSCNKYIIGETVPNYGEAFEKLKSKLGEGDDIFQYIHWEKKNASGEYESMETPRITSTSELEGKSEL